MGFFEHYFNIEDSGDEHAVCCPFPHHTNTGLEYYETNPSAHVNTKDRLFHCKVCNEGHSEVSFIKAVLQCTFANATRISKAFNNYETYEEWQRCREINDNLTGMCQRFNITDTVREELSLLSNTENSICFPVFLYGKLVDIRTYIPDGKPKMRSRAGAPSGLIIPYDVWKDNNKITLICAGEKDMAVTRSHGFNAINLTGGEMSLPLSPIWFKDKDVVILYDNDEAGKLGAIKLATYLLPYCHTVKNCTAFHETCKEDKEDMTDFFNKYNKTREDLIAYMNATPYFTEEDSIKNSPIPLVTLQEATQPNNLNRLVRSNIQVAAVSEVQFALPCVITGEKLKATGDAKETMVTGEVRDWELNDNHLVDILHLIDNNFKSKDIRDNAKELLHIPKTEKYVSIKYAEKAIVYKAYVTEMMESSNMDTTPMEYTCYSIGHRLESGKKYMVTYKLVPHPYKGQQLIMLITDVVTANDSVSNFIITDKVKDNLAIIQNIPGTTDEKINTLVQKVKGLLGYDGSDTLITTMDLAYHTVLNFNFGTFKNVRGYLDTLIVGESRVGKSSTAEALRKTYQLGAFTSLAGNSATVPGLIGGSNKTNGGAFQTKAGLIPQNHKGLIIFEEFGKCNTNIVRELTDIRSSNEVRITRVSGTLALPALVRMISLSNVKTTSGEIKSIASYPNGISIVTELVSTAEDIARYDVMAILGDKGAKEINPLWKPEEPYADEVYQTRIRWVWSRTAEQVVMSDEVCRYIIETANILNKNYDCHIKIFGTEAWKKVARLAIAVAAYTVSTDETYNNIIVTKEHVEWATQFFIKLYDNPVFRLREYVESERKYSVIDEDGVQLLTNLYIKAPALLLMLEQEARPSRNTLMAAAGLETKDYNLLMNQLIRGSFVKLVGNDVLPTERFRLGMARVPRDVTVPRLGETNV